VCGATPRTFFVLMIAVFPRDRYALLSGITLFNVARSQ
jgi:hypothetical protein